MFFLFLLTYLTWILIKFVSPYLRLQLYACPVFKTRNPTYLGCLCQLWIYSWQFESQNPSDPFYFQLINEPIKYATKKGPAIDVLFPRYMCDPYKCSYENVYLYICNPCLYCEIRLTKSLLLANLSACGIFSDEEQVTVFDRYN